LQPPPCKPCHTPTHIGEDDMLDTVINDQVTQLLDAFGAALEAGDIARVTDMFEEDCYWRDLATFT